MTVALAGVTTPQKLPNLVPIDTGRIALLDSYGRIVAVNKQWSDLAEQMGISAKRVGPGVNYLEVCRRSSGSTADARNALKGIRAVLHEKAQSFTMDYSAPLSEGPSYFRMIVTPFSHGDVRVAVAHVDVTDLRVSKDVHFRRLQKFAHRLIRVQEEERERISREIHDDLSNRIALLASMVRRMTKGPGKRSSSVVQELSHIMDSITDLSTALRDLSHCLHPPVLKYAGISVALKALCEEFGRSNGIQMDVIVPAQRARLPEEVELCLFRISQECLTNIAKHSQADSVRVVLEITANQVGLRVTDTGRGFVQSEAIQKGGLGLVSMEERVVSLGGHLEVHSAPGAGSKIQVMIPTDDNQLVDSKRLSH